MSALLRSGKSRQIITMNSYSIFSRGTPSRAIRRASLIISCTVSGIVKSSIIGDY
jgi:hypothetical protein